MEKIGFAEGVAAIILYGIFYYILITFANKISYKKIKKEIFDPGYQIFFGIGAILFLIFININHHTTFSLIMKIGMGILIIAVILFYLFSKFSEFPFGWAILSIILDILAIPIAIVLFLLVLGAAFSTNYANCWWWCDND